MIRTTEDEVPSSSTLRRGGSEAVREETKMLIWNLLLIILLCSWISADNASDTNLLVLTKNGPVRGKIVTGYMNKKARAFYGIPYAEPPVGKLRFKPPLPVSSWTEEFDATRNPLPCYQTYTKELLDLHRILERTVRRPWSEDCLTLNVWTPEVVPDDAPVVIFIHDGLFLAGTGVYPHLELSIFSTETQTVALSLNYRLGAFGFLSLGTTDTPGNLGLMDQHLALRWTFDNVNAFGGKASAIFLAGIGDGSASVGHQIILEQNAGLFRTGFVQTASPLCSWAWHTKDEAVKLGRSLAHNVGCHNDDSELDCLQNVHPEDIVDATILASTHETDLFKPNVDGHFIKEPPVEAMKAGRFRNATVIAVNAVAESAIQFYNLNKDLLSEEEGLTVEGFDEALRRTSLVQTENELEMVREWYLKDTSQRNTTEIRDQAVQAYSDGFRVCCTSKFLDYATKRGVLTYKIVFTIPDPRFPLWMGPHDTASIPILVGYAIKPESKFGDKVRQDTLGALATTRIFLRKKAKEFEKIVPLYNLEDRPYMEWGLTYQHLKNHKTKDCRLWNDILPKIRSRLHDCL